MSDIKQEPTTEWRAFAEHLGKLAQEHGLLGIIVAGFSPVDANGMEIHLSMMNDPGLCTHDKLGMRLKTIEKLAVTAFEQYVANDHDHHDHHEHGDAGGLQ